MKNLFPFGGFKIFKPFQVVIEQIEGDGVGKVVRVDQNESVGQWAMIGIEHVQAGQFVDKVALTVQEGKAETLSGGAG